MTSKGHQPWTRLPGPAGDAGPVRGAAGGDQRDERAGLGRAELNPRPLRSRRPGRGSLGSLNRTGSSADLPARYISIQSGDGLWRPRRTAVRGRGCGYAMSFVLPGWDLSAGSAPVCRSCVLPGLSAAADQIALPRHWRVRRAPPRAAAPDSRRPGCPAPAPNAPADRLTHDRVGPRAPSARPVPALSSPSLSRIGSIAYQPGRCPEPSPSIHSDVTTTSVPFPGQPFPATGV
jgi:hypothetical protein